MKQYEIIRHLVELVGELTIHITCYVTVLSNGLKKTNGLRKQCPFLDEVSSDSSPKQAVALLVGVGTDVDGRLVVLDELEELARV